MRTKQLLGGCLGLMLMLGGMVMAQVDHPPPLGYGLDSEHYERYYVYDFESKRATEIPSKIPFQYTGEGGPMIQATNVPPPEECPIQSPIDPTIHFVQVKEKNPERPEFPYYDLYRVLADGSRELIALKASVAENWPEYWSPNGRYLYFLTEGMIREQWLMQQYDIEQHQLKTMGGTFEDLGYCQTDGAWCIAESESILNAFNTPSIVYLLNRDDGSLRELAHSRSSGVRPLWLENGQAFVFTNMEYGGKLDIYYYNIPAAEQKLLTELKAEGGGIDSASPDERWVLLQANLGANNPHSLLAFDMQHPDAEPIMITGYIWPFSNSNDKPHWVDADTLVYLTHQERQDSVIYRVDFPEGKPVEIARFKTGISFYDHTWSPDGHWLALSTGYWDNDASRGIYVVSIEGAVSKLPVDLSPDSGICVGWFSEAEYAGGKANLCDVYLGMG